MGLHADGVSEAMREIFAVSCFGDHVPRRLVQIAETHAWTNQAFRFFVGAADEVVDRSVVGIGRFAEKGTGHIGAVALFFAAHIDNDAVAGL